MRADTRPKGPPIFGPLAVFLLGRRSGMMRRLGGSLRDSARAVQRFTQSLRSRNRFSSIRNPQTYWANFVPHYWRRSRRRSP